MNLPFYRLCAVAALVGAVVLAPTVAVAVPVFTGNADVDFSNADTSIRIDDSPAEDFRFAGRISGLAMDSLFLDYDPAADVLYVGIATTGIAGDVDGDGDPGRTSPELAAVGGVDQPDFGGGESFALLIDTDGDGVANVIAGVGAGASYSQFTVARPVLQGGMNPYPPAGFGVGLAQHTGRPFGTGPDISRPHVEFTVLQVSRLPGLPGDGSLGTLRVLAFMGSIDDAAIGDDWLPAQSQWAEACFDADGDGVTTCGGDCRDGDPLVLPGAVERCDGVDQDCDGRVDEACVTTCGDGFRGPEEACDDGNAVDGDGCDTNCTPTGCGNGVVTSGEVCDDGNRVDGDGCDRNCTPTGCGNGVVTAGEQCDDGNDLDGDGCDVNCTFTACGNGVLTAGEDCDDGNLVDGDGCSADCRFECGDERCNGKDDDCDGRVDEDFALGEVCVSGLGMCEADGRTVCAPNGVAIVCSGSGGRPAAVEACNQRDDDCDGEVDEGFALGEACTLGEGACAASGVRVCRADERGGRCDAVPGAPSPEVCNDVDDDCDGKIDEAEAPLTSVCATARSVRGGGCIECSVGVGARGPGAAREGEGPGGALPWLALLWALRPRRLRDGVAGGRA